MYAREVYVCFDCLNAYYNGEVSDDIEPGTEPLNKMPEGYWLESKTCEHGEYCDTCDSPSSVEHFARTCGTCDTRWAGARFDYLLVGE